MQWARLAGAALVVAGASGGCAAGPLHYAAATGPAVAVAAVPGKIPCTTAVARAPRLRRVRTAMVAVRGFPFGVAVTHDGRWAFVSLINAVDVFRVRPGSLIPSFVRTIRVRPEAVGLALTPDGRYLLAASLSGAVVISVARAEQGSAHAVLGTLSGGHGFGAIEVAVSPDGRFAFVSLEFSAELAVFNLHTALKSGFHRSGFAGTIPVGLAPVGMAFSPSGRWLYATSEVARPARPSPGGPQGTLSVINVRRAERDPARSVVSTVTAGCGPVRVIISANGAVVWVTARESDALLGFSAARLTSDPRRSLVADVQVGEAPVGLALVAHGTRIIVADSNRFRKQGATSNLAVVNAAAALAHHPALLGLVRAGLFPREMALERTGRTLLVTNFASRQLEAVDLAQLP